MEPRLFELLEKGRRAYAFPHASVVTTKPTRGQLTIPVSRKIEWASVTRDHATDLGDTNLPGRDANLTLRVQALSPQGS